MRKSVVYRYGLTAVYPTTGSHFPWEGGPTKVAPLTDYITPGMDAAAQELNYVLWAAGQTEQNILDQVGTMSVHNWPIGATAADPLVNVCKDSLNGRWVTQTTNAGTIGWTLYYPGVGSLAFPGSGAPTTANDSIVVNDSGVLVATKTDTNTTALGGTSYLTSTTTGAWSTIGAAPAGAGHALCWYAAVSKFVCVAVRNGGTSHWVTTSPDGATWSDHSGTAGFALRGNYNAGFFAQDRSGAFSSDLLYFYPDGGTHYYRTSDGATWTQKTTPHTATELVIGADFDADSGLWVILTRDGVSAASFIYTSTDGNTWSSAIPMLTTVANTTTFLTGLAVTGSLWAVILNSGQSSDRSKVFYSVDKGVTWRTAIGFGDAYAATTTYRILTNDSHFLAYQGAGTQIKNSLADSQTAAVT